MVGEEEEERGGITALGQAVSGARVLAARHFQDHPAANHPAWLSSSALRVSIRGVQNSGNSEFTE